MTRAYCPTHEVHGDPDCDRTWQVYTCFAVDGTPLYVGISDHPATRLLWHAKYSGSGHWYYYCSRVEVSQPFTCRYDAHEAEIATIGRLHPAFNKHHNPAPREWMAPDGYSLRYGQIPLIECAAPSAVSA